MGFINEQSRDKIKLSLLFDSIRENEPDLTFSDQEMIDRIKAFLKEAGNENPDEALSRLAQSGQLTGAVAALKDKATIEWLVNQSNIIE